MAIPRNELAVGQKIIIPATEMTIINVAPDTNGDGNYRACIEVRDSSGRYHFIFPELMRRPLPYLDGADYLSSDGTFWRYIGTPDGISEGRWQRRFNIADEDEEFDEEPEAFSYPVRPLREVNLDPDEIDD